MKNNYDLLNGLFAGQKMNNAVPVIDEKVERFTSKRTFKILNEPWEDFLILTALKGQTQAELINSLISQVVFDNMSEITRYKEFVKKT